MEPNSDRWASMTFAQQMANIGSEVGRSARWLSKNNSELAGGAFGRALDLIDLTIQFGRIGITGRGCLLRELCRARECYVEAFLAADYSTLSYLDRYFTCFAAICRR